MDCLCCGACCVAPDIAALDKPLGQRCPRLGPDLRCTDYEHRPQVCRSYRPDALCRQIQAPTLEARVANYLEVFGLAEEARVASQVGSMRAARRSRTETP